MGGTYSRSKYDKTSYWRGYFADDIPKDAAAGKTVAVTGATANGLGIWLAKHAALLGAKRVVLLKPRVPAKRRGRGGGARVREGARLRVRDPHN
jgi:hypothetical protein